MNSNFLNVQNQSTTNDMGIAHKNSNNSGASTDSISDRSYHDIQQEANKASGNESHEEGKSLPENQAKATADTQKSTDNTVGNDDQKIDSKSQPKELDDDEVEANDGTQVKVESEVTAEFIEQVNGNNLNENILVRTHNLQQNATIIAPGNIQSTIHLIDENSVDDSDANLALTRLGMSVPISGSLQSIISNQNSISKNQITLPLVDNSILATASDDVALDELNLDLDVPELQNKAIEFEAEFELKQLIQKEMNVKIEMPAIKNVALLDNENLNVQDSNNNSQTNLNAQIVTNNQLNSSTNINPYTAKILEAKMPYSNDKIANQDLSNKVMLMINKNESSAKINLDPPELGHLEIRITHQDGGTNIVFNTSTQHAKDALENQLQDLRANFENQGLDLGDVSVFQQESDYNNEKNEDNQSNTSAEAEEAVETIRIDMSKNSIIDLYA